MPAMLRPRGKATRIAQKILGLPFNGLPLKRLSLKRLSLNGKKRRRKT